MLSVKQRAEVGAVPSKTLTLPFDRRQKSRLRATVDGGEGPELAIELQRGTSLRDGDLLLADNGLVIAIKAAAESVSVVRSDDTLALTRAAYHLGNRHVPLQVGRNELLYLHDHVLDDMVRALGVSVTAEQRAFEPEPGAYGKGHSHLHHSHLHHSHLHHSHPQGGHGAHSHDH